MKTNTECNHIEILEGKLFVWFQERNSVDVIQTSDKEILKSFKGFKRLAKTDQWIYSISPKGITRIDSKTLSIKAFDFDLNPKSLVAHKNKLFFIIKNKAFSIADQSEKANQEIDLDKAYNNYHLFITDNFICVPFDTGSPDTTGKTICYNLRNKEKIEIDGYNPPLDTSITKNDKILLKNIVNGHPKYGFSEYDLANEGYIHFGNYKNMAYNQGNLYYYDDRHLRKFMNNSFPKIFSAKGYIRYVREHEGILFITTDMGQLHAISKVEN